MTIWRINLKTDAEEHIDQRRFCIENNILGVGWPVENGHCGMDWETYRTSGMEEYHVHDDKGWWRALNAIRNRMEIGDLCWTRDWGGNYYLGRISGYWEYRATQDYKDADVVNIRACNWVPVGNVDSVPGKVLNSFRVGRTVQAVHDTTVNNYSRFMYNSMTGNDVYPIDDIEADLFALIFPEDCEDIVGIYLQVMYNYTLIPSTCKKDTLRTEFVLRNANGERANVQVKQGIELDRSDFYQENQDDPSEWFLFSTIGQYYGEPADHIICLDPQVMLRFVIDHRNRMSDRVRNFMDLTGRL